MLPCHCTGYYGICLGTVKKCSVSVIKTSLSKSLYSNIRCHYVWGFTSRSDIRLLSCLFIILLIALRISKVLSYLTDIKFPMLDLTFVFKNWLQFF